MECEGEIRHYFPPCGKQEVAMGFGKITLESIICFVIERGLPGRQCGCLISSKNPSQMFVCIANSYVQDKFH